MVTTTRRRKGEIVRHLELVDALKAAGMEVYRGEKLPGGFLWYTVGGERHRLEWIGPRTGDNDVDFVTTTNTSGGLGWTLRSLKFAVAYVTGRLFAWEAHFAERHEDLERDEALTS